MKFAHFFVYFAMVATVCLTEVRIPKPYRVLFEGMKKTFARNELDENTVCLKIGTEFATLNKTTDLILVNLKGYFQSDFEDDSDLGTDELEKRFESLFTDLRDIFVATTDEEIQKRREKRRELCTLIGQIFEEHSASTDEEIMEALEEHAKEKKAELGNEAIQKAKALEEAQRE